MPDVVEKTGPTRLRAEWDIHDLRVERTTGGLVTLSRAPAGARLLAISPAAAEQLGAVIAAAAHWTPEPIVDATIIDERPRYDYGVIREAAICVRPDWMTTHAAEALADALLVFLHRNSYAVIVRDGEEWTP